MCKLTCESMLILSWVMFDAEFNSLSVEIIFEEGHYVKIRSLRKNTGKIRKFSPVIHL